MNEEHAKRKLSAILSADAVGVALCKKMKHRPSTPAKGLCENWKEFSWIVIQHDRITGFDSVDDPALILGSFPNKRVHYLIVSAHNIE